MYIIKIITIYTISDIKFLFEHVQELLSLRTLYRHSIDVKKKLVQDIELLPARNENINWQLFFFSTGSKKYILILIVD